MSADEHPSQRRLPPCWCHTPRSRWGCYVHGPTPLEPGEPAACVVCSHVTYNLNLTCDPCVGILAHMAQQLAGAS